MSSQTTNNYWTAPILPNPYMTRKLNNMNEAKMMKEERNNWTKMYYKMLKGLETMIDMQKQVKDIMKIAAETNMTITEMEDTICYGYLDTNNFYFILFYFIFSDFTLLFFYFIFLERR